MQSPRLVHGVLPIFAWSQIANSPIRSSVMNGRILIGGTIAVALASLAAVGFSGSPQVEVTDFATAPRRTQPVYDARLAPVSSAPVKEFRIPIRDATVEIAKGVTYKSWTFGGTVPGPVVRVREGDLVRIRLVNEASMPHSMQGMYLPIIVDPKGGWPGKVDKEFVIVQSEFYVQGGDSALPGQADW